MNTIDTILNGKFTNYNGMKFFGDKKKITTGNIKMLSEMFSKDELMDLIQNYKGEHYMELIHLAIKFNELNIAMDIALINEDWNMCKEIRYELQKEKINKEQPERRNNYERDMRNEKDNHKKFIMDSSPFLSELLFGGNLNQFDFHEPDFYDPDFHKKNNRIPSMEDILNKYYHNRSKFDPRREKPTNSKDFEEIIKKMFPQGNVNFFYIDEDNKDERDDYGFEEEDD